MPNSLIVESIHPETVHKEPKRIVAVSIDDNSAEYVYDWAVNNFINPATDMVRNINHCTSFNSYSKLAGRLSELSYSRPTCRSIFKSYWFC